MRTLADFPLFHQVPEKTIRALVSGLAEARFKTGDRLIRQGEPGVKAFLLLEGNVAISTSSASGTETNLLFHPAPALFGVIELFEERPYLGNAVALEPCRALEMKRSQFLSMLQSNHQISINLNRLLCHEIYDTGIDQRIRLFGTIDHLIANTIVYLALLSGEKSDQGVLVRNPPNKSELASLVGISRKSVIQAMARLEMEGLIAIEGKHLLIPNLKKLEARAREAWPR